MITAIIQEGKEDAPATCTMVVVDKMFKIVEDVSFDVVLASTVVDGKIVVVGRTYFIALS